MFRRAPIIIVWSLILVTIIINYLPKNSFLSTYRSKSTDFFFRYRHSKGQIPPEIERIVIVNIDEDTLGRLKQRWPMDRNLYASFLKNIDKGSSRPLIVGMDLVFAGESQKEEDVLFANTLKEAGNVVIASYFDDKGRMILPETPFLKSAKAVGFISSPRDSDLVIRRAYTSVSLDGRGPYYSFVYRIYCGAKGSDPSNVLLPVGGRDHTIRTNFFAKFEDFKVVPFWEALESIEAADTFKGKIVLVGTKMEMHHDVYPSPLGLMPGIGINANVLLTLLSGRFVKEIPSAMNNLLLFLVASLIGFATYRMNNVKGFIVSMAMVAISFYTTTLCIANDIIFDFFGFTFIVASSFITMAIFKHVSILIENARLSRLALTDGLTGLYHFRYFEAKLKSEIRNAIHKKTDLSLMLLDIDHFKQINDTHGHDFGNEILKSLASIMKKYSRRTDTLVRFGGDEFAVILPHATLSDANKFAEAVKVAFKNLNFKWEGKPINVTISAGTASLFRQADTTTETLIKSADKALYEAKAQGRDRVVGS